MFHGQLYHLLGDLVFISVSFDFTHSDKNAIIPNRTICTINQAIIWPPTGVIDRAGFDIQVKLFNFIVWLIPTTESVFETDKAQVDDKACRHLMAGAQDLIHCSSQGRVKIPKYY